MYDRIVRIRRSRLYFVETVLGMMIMAGINVTFLKTSPAFEGVHPNPLWIIIIAIAARYGRNGALFSSILVSVYFAAYNILIHGVDIFYEDLWLLRYPFFFLLVGFLIGEVKTVYILREEYLTSRVEELEKQNSELRNENEIVKEAHKDLTIDVATSQDTITILNEITDNLKSTNIDDIYTGILNSLHDHLNAEECSFYALEGNLLALKCTDGWKDYYKRPESFELGEGLVGLSAQNKEVLSIKDVVLKRRKSAAQDLDMLGDSVLVVPVLGIDDKVYGVASVEKIDLLSLTDSTIQAARITCELAASSLNNAYSIQSIKEQQIRGEEFNLFRYHYFIERLEQEFLRSLNYMLPLSIMAFKWPKLSDLTGEKRAAIFGSIVEIISSNLRAFDVLAKGPIKETPLVLLLATTPGPQANGLKEKFIGKIKDYEFEDIIGEKSLEESVVISDFNPNKVSNAKDMLKIIGL